MEYDNRPVFLGFFVNLCLGLILLGLCLGLLLCGIGHAQMATEIMPGVTYYGGTDGGTMGVEIMPGYRQYSGDVQGHSVEVMPGVRSYSLQPSDSYTSMWGEPNRAPLGRLPDHDLFTGQSDTSPYPTLAPRRKP